MAHRHVEWRGAETITGVEGDKELFRGGTKSLEEIEGNLAATTKFAVPAVGEGEDEFPVMAGVTHTDPRRETERLPVVLVLVSREETADIAALVYIEHASEGGPVDSRLRRIREVLRELGEGGTESDKRWFDESGAESARS